jgi:hypothetical protein
MTELFHFMTEDEFNAVPSPNKDLAEQIREKFKRWRTSTLS